VIRRFARPYAKALSELITTPEEARKVFEEMERFEEARRSSSELQQLFDHPGIKVESKRSVIRTIGERLKISDFGMRVLEVLLKNHRINALGAILEAWRDLINQSEGIAVAEVRVAQKLGAPEQDRLRKALEQRLGRKVDMHLSVDPKLLGGFVARVGSEVYDASVTGRIEKFRQSIHEA
jgi:F-type H+-transporting ATPase subunit delta